MTATKLQRPAHRARPLSAGIATGLRGNRAHAVGLMAFILFIGYGLGSLLFQLAPTQGFVAALVVFGCASLVAAGIAIPLFRAEHPHAALP